MAPTRSPTLSEDILMVLVCIRNWKLGRSDTEKSVMGMRILHNGHRKLSDRAAPMRSAAAFAALPPAPDPAGADPQPACFTPYVRQRMVCAGRRIPILSGENHPRMEPHHAESIRNVVNRFEADPAIRALLLGGSIVHGFAKPDSDVDVAIVVGADEFARRRSEGRLTLVDRTLCTYEGGYVDGKFMDEAFLHEVARHGSEPARYAFHGAQILFSRVAGLERLLADIVRYPVAGKGNRIARFASQLVAWRWFFTEGVRKENAYLRTLAVQKVVLFSCRIVLAVNELLFPFHKWMLRVTLAAPRLPNEFGGAIDRILAGPSFELIDAHCRSTLAFAGLDHDAVNTDWGTHFMRDTELRWMTDSASIDDC